MLLIIARLRGGSMKSLTIILVSLFISTVAFATNDLDGYLSLDESSIKIQEVPVSPSDIDPLPYEDLGDVIDNIDSVGIILDKIINIGEKVWRIVEAGKPVKNIRKVTASALPEGVRSWGELNSWKAPRVKEYVITADNLWGSRCIDVQYRVMYTYGGALNDKGQFLSNVRVFPTKVNIAWGYSLNVNVEIADPINMGTREDPLAGLEVLVSTEISTALKLSENGQSFFITGAGDFTDHAN